MTSNRPYLIRALYDWLTDNDLTPYLLVDATRDDVHVPEDYIEDGRIVLNISPTAVRDLALGNEQISFSARFGGREREIFVPPEAVLGVYSRENQQGMLFHEEPGGQTTTPGDPTDPTGPKPPAPGGGGRPSLKVVK
jgi:stringent starvation protein B